MKLLTENDLFEDMNTKDVGEFIGGFELPIKPISKSNFKPRRSYLPKKYKEYENIIGQAALSLSGRNYKSGHVVIKPSFTKPNTHRTDLNNLPKSACDALVKVKIFEDDVDVAVTVLSADFGKESIKIYAYGKR